MHFNGQKFSVVLEQLSFTRQFFFFVKIDKIDFFLRKMGFGCSFYKIEVYVFTN